MYRATTEGIEITVAPAYSEERSDPAHGLYFWTYTIEIVNRGEETVQLLSREWHITDALAQEEVVRGPGVVGEQPVLAPGERHRYTSGCPLPTPSGSMEGHFIMSRFGKETFKAQVPPFSLDLPGAITSLN
ncbi:MAG: Co2+/Mg2+ efflux protein ApaG [Hyphomicrobiaceae bacterium]|nr:Co2+/Mg2+ efflux protein ApaG [Hyphomicrobiaceae bacterium]